MYNKIMPDMLDIEILGNRIREARKEIGFTQAELADELGLSQAMVNKLETGRSKVTLEKLFSLSLALRQPVAYFLNIGTSALTADESELVRLYRAIPENVAKDAVIDMVRSVANRYRSNKSERGL